MTDDTRRGRDVRGGNTYVFFQGHGDDIITGFDAGGDAIDLSWFETAITFEQLRGKFSATAGGTIIDLDEFGGAEISIEGVVPADLTEEVFLLPDGGSPLGAPIEAIPLTGDDDGGIGDPFWIEHRTEKGVETTHLRILKVRDDSMEPKIREGDRVVVDLVIRKPETGVMFLLGLGDELVVRQVEAADEDGADEDGRPRLRFISTNPDYAPCLAEDVYILGKVVWIVQRV